MKHSLLVGDYSDGEPKTVDLDNRLEARQLTWIKRLRDNSHPF